jgi:D-tyrosyl-tRNA(Tyr) deacylase
VIALLQRVSEASVRVEGKTVGAISKGVVVFLGVVKGDDETVAAKLADKVADFRILAGDDGRPNKSLVETGDSAALVVSQFTLAADTQKGRRADYGPAAPGPVAKALYEEFVAKLRTRGVRVETGVFGADMKVALVNDGPVTFWLELP